MFVLPGRAPRNDEVGRHRRRDKLPAKFVNAFKKSPVATVLDSAVDNREVHGWISQRLAHAPVKLVPAAAALVESHLGEDFDA